MQALEESCRLTPAANNPYCAHRLPLQAAQQLEQERRPAAAALAYEAAVRVRLSLCQNFTHTATELSPAATGSAMCSVIVSKFDSQTQRRAEFKEHNVKADVAYQPILSKLRNEQCGKHLSLSGQTLTLIRLTWQVETWARSQHVTRKP